MLWDCPFCGTSKLLGLTHRHCPACGAAQDASRRYYPSDADKIAVSDHVYFGADIACPACATPNGAAAQFCTGCGSPLQGGKAVEGRADQVARPGQGFSGETVEDARAEARARRQAKADAAQGRTPAPPGLPRGAKIALVVGGAVLVVVALVLTVVLWRKDVALTVDGHSWERTIAVEQFRAVSESAWCDQMPAEAYAVTRSKEVRDTKKVPDGEECKTRRRDNKDGTFEEVQECTPKYRSEPVYDTKCRFQIDRWVKARVEKASGRGKEPAPSWPEVKLEKTGTCKGCEREGERNETYTVHFVDPQDEEIHDCAFPADAWSNIEPGSRWTAKVGVVSSALDCDSLVPAD